MKVTTFEADRQMCTQSSDPAQQQMTHGRMKINVQSAVYIQLCFAIHGFRLHLKCGGCYVKVSVCKFHRADIHEVGMCISHVARGAYKQDSGSWELSRVKHSVFGLQECTNFKI